MPVATRAGTISLILADCRAFIVATTSLRVGSEFDRDMRWDINQTEVKILWVHPEALNPVG
jgi:hypothetical protein